MNIRSFFFSVIVLFIACWSQASTQPNIVWMVSEDNGARWLGCYGNPASPTPNLDRMAEEGFRYENCYASIPVCAPQRFTWITGINAISAGTQGMRSGVNLPDRIRFYPEIFEELGYYRSKGNDSKTDYNFRGRNANDTWSDPKKIDWENLKNNQPFIHVFNTHSSHEWNSFGGFKPEKDAAPVAENLASYHPDLPEMRFVYDKYNKAISKMDAEMGQWLQELEEQGLAEKTIVIYSSDHGGVLPRSKRYLYNSGTHCPLIVRIPESLKHFYPAAKPGMTVDELVSFTDFPKTWLSLGGATAEQLEQMQGRVFLGEGKEPEPKQVYSFRQRMDDRFDMARSVRDGDSLYIKNYMPFAPVGQYLPYCHNSVSMRAWRKHHEEGKTDALTGRFFQQPRAVDVLYAYESDYDNVINLAEAQGNRVKAMQATLRAWQLDIFDSGFLPEDDIGRLAKEQGLTVYDYVRDPKLYPLQRFMDLADRSLAMDAQNLPGFLNGLESPLLGDRYWSTLGVLNLTFAGKAAHRTEVQRAMQQLLDNSKESQVIQAYAAWILVRIGQPDVGMSFLGKLSQRTYTIRSVINVLDWMDGEKSGPLVKELYLSASNKGGDQNKVLVQKLKECSSEQMVGLIELRESLRGKIKAKQGRLKKLGKSPGNMTPEKIEKETTKVQRELDDALREAKALDKSLAALN